METPVNRDSEMSLPALLKLLAWVVLTLMLAATAYTAWIAFGNYHRIGV
jgi:hypothetical protein